MSEENIWDAKKRKCCATVFLSFPFALGRIRFVLRRFAVTSPGVQDMLSFQLTAQEIVRAYHSCYITSLPCAS